MNGSLTRKLLLFYLMIIAILFFIANTIVPKRLEKNILEEREQKLYADAGVVTEGYVRRYYDSRITISKLMENLEPVADLLNVRIMIVASWGKVVGDTAPMDDTVLQMEEIVPGFLEQTIHRDFYNQKIGCKLNSYDHWYRK